MWIDLEALRDAIGIAALIALGLLVLVVAVCSYVWP